MRYKLLWVSLLGLLSAILTFGMPGEPDGDLNGAEPGNYSQEEDKGGGTDPDGLTGGGGTDAHGQDKGGNTDPDG